MSQEAYNLYIFYIALKRHFTSDYDYFKYNGKVNQSQSAFERRNDKPLFVVLSKKEKNPKSYIFANILANPEKWIGDIVKDKENSNRTFIDWERRMQSLTYIFQEDIGKLNHNFDENFSCKDGQHPVILKKFLREEISLETLVILDMLVKFVPVLDKKLKNDPIWNQISLKIKKYKPFLEINISKYKDIVIKKFSP